MIIDKSDLLFAGCADAKDIKSLKSLWREAFGDSEDFIDGFFKNAFSPLRCRAVKDKESVVAALYIFDCYAGKQKIAYIYAVATRKSHRGKGICRYLMNDTHDYLSSMGYTASVLVPGDKTLFDFYEKMGYSVCSEVSVIHTEASKDSVKLARIDKCEYADARRKLLPANGVIQENENLDFLETYTSFYKGEGCVLAAHKQGEHLICDELLGDASVAPKIVAALGAKRGSFRIQPVENAVPFAMAFPLNQNKIQKIYFGLAFD